MSTGRRVVSTLIQQRWRAVIFGNNMSLSSARTDLAMPVAGSSGSDSNRQTNLSQGLGNFSRGILTRKNYSCVPEGSSLITVKSSTGFRELLNAAKENSQLVVADFTASWCGPCKRIAPVYESLSKEFSDVSFLKLDIDEDGLQDTVSALQVSSVPTFMFFKDGKKVSQFAGADEQKLRETILVLRKP